MASYGSAISKYYVHYRAQSYIYNDKSVNAKNSAAMIEYAQIKATQYAGALKSSVSKEKKKKYLNAINALMGRKNNLSQEQQKWADQAYSELEKIVLQKNQNFLINRLSGAVTRLVQDSSQPAYQLSTQEQAMSQESAEDFIQKFNSLTAQLSRQLKDGKINGAEDPILNNIQSLTQQLNQKYEQAKLLASSSIQEGKGIVSQSFRNLTHAPKLQSKNWLLLDDEWREYIATFNLLAQKYNFICDTAKLMQGTHFENILAASAELAFNTGTGALIDNLEEVLKASVVGSTPVNAEFLMDGVDAEVWKRQNLSQGKKDYSTFKNGVKVHIKPNYSLGKVDVTLDYDKGILTRTGQPVNISAKSIKGLSEIGIVKATTADAIIDREENEYKKMYLNIMAKHSDEIDTIFGVQPGDDSYYSLAKAESIALNILEQQRKDAILSFKTLAAYRSLTGDVLGRAAAQLFVINDVNTQKVYLLEMKDIISAIIQEMQQGANISKFFKFESVPDFGQLYYLNDLVEGENGEYSRIANLLNDVHAHKIQVALKGNDSWLKQIGISIDAKGKIT